MTSQRAENWAGCQYVNREVASAYRGPRGVGGHQIKQGGWEDRVQPAVGEQVEVHRNTGMHVSQSRAVHRGDTNHFAWVQPGL